MASTVFPTRTRVTVTYKGAEHQAIVKDGSTDKLAKVEILGRAGSHPVVSFPWSALTKVEYRCFKIDENAETITITEVEPQNTHPMNWMMLRHSSREGAWAFAQARGKKVVFVSREGERQELGHVFNPAQFERAAYSGYTAYGYSMTDGYYAPIQFDHWVKSFRKDPAGHLARQNDADESVKAALPQYQAALASL